MHANLLDHDDEAGRKANADFLHHDIEVDRKATMMKLLLLTPIFMAAKESEGAGGLVIIQYYYLRKVGANAVMIMVILFGEILILIGHWK